MPEILDEPFEKENNTIQLSGQHYTEQAYSKLLKSIAWAIGGVFIFIIGMIFNKYSGVAFFVTYTFILFLLSFSFSISGFANAVLSFYKKEESNSKKWISLFGNLFFPIALGIFLFTVNSESLF